MVWKGHIMTYIYNGNLMKQLLIDPVILSAVTLTQPFVVVQRPPLWPQSSGLNASPVKTLLSELPFLCLLTAARWRHKTSLSLRHIYFLTMRFSCKVVCHLICLNLLMSQQNVQQWIDKSEVCSHAFRLFPANTLVFSNVFGSLYKISPLRSGGTSAQKIKKI